MTIYGNGKREPDYYDDYDEDGYNQFARDMEYGDSYDEDFYDRSYDDDEEDKEDEEILATKAEMEANGIICNYETPEEKRAWENAAIESADCLLSDDVARYIGYGSREAMDACYEALAKDDYENACAKHDEHSMFADCDSDNMIDGFWYRIKA